MGPWCQNFPPPPSGFLSGTGPFETSTTTFVSKLSQATSFCLFFLGTPIPGWQSLILGLWGGFHIFSALAGKTAFLARKKLFKISAHAFGSAPSPRKILFCGKGKLERIALTSASFTPQIQPLINCVWPRRNAKMAIQAQDASLLLDGLGQPLNLFIWRNVKIAIHQNVKAVEQDKVLKFREINKLSYVVGSQSGWVGRLTQNFLNPFDIPSRP